MARDTPEGNRDKLLPRRELESHEFAGVLDPAAAVTVYEDLAGVGSSGHKGRFLPSQDGNLVAVGLVRDQHPLGDEDRVAVGREIGLRGDLVVFVDVDDLAVANFPAHRSAVDGQCRSGLVAVGIDRPGAEIGDLTELAVGSRDDLALVEVELAEVDRGRRFETAKRLKLDEVLVLPRDFGHLDFASAEAGVARADDAVDGVAELVDGADAHRDLLVVVDVLLFGAATASGDEGGNDGGGDGEQTVDRVHGELLSWLELLRWMLQT